LQTDVRKIGKRLFILFAIVAALLILLAVRVGYWSLYKGDWLQEMAESQWITDSEVQAKRGSITDRNLNLLAESASSDTVVLLPKRIEDPAYVAQQLSVILEMPYESVLEKASNTKKTEIWLKRQISSEQTEKISSLAMDGVSLIRDTKRYYPNKSFASQVIGYTTVDGEGQMGIEKRYNSILAGRQGRMVAETDKLSNEIPNGQEMFIEPVNGRNVVLTIDEVMQSFLETSCQSLYDAAAPEGVMGIVMDVTNGEVMAMANMPAFDLNDPPRQDADALIALSSNKVTAQAFEPGTLFQAFTVAKAAELGMLSETLVCEGSVVIDGEKIACEGAHGSQTVEQALMSGCTAGIAQLADKMGKDAFYDMINAFGFGEKTGIDFSSDATGEVLAQKYARDADVANMANGTGVKTTQLQLASAFAAMVNGGQDYAPRLVLELQDEQGNKEEDFPAVSTGQAVSQGTSDAMRAILENQAAPFIAGYSAGAIKSASPYYEDSIPVAGKETVTCMAYGSGAAPKYLVMITAVGIPAESGGEDALDTYVKQVLEEVLKYSNIQPDNEETRGAEKVKVPDLTGLELAAAQEALEMAGLACTADGTGKVVSQVPAAGEEVYTGTGVLLTMETKEEQPDEEGETAETVLVPDFTGLSFAQARDLAIASGLEFVALGDGKAKSQYPLKDTPVEKGSKVEVTFGLVTGE
jgi:stage V sporulation protein D (sporulation-specific penicillin-binding protein)